MHACLGNSCYKIPSADDISLNGVPWTNRHEERAGVTEHQLKLAPFASDEGRSPSPYFLLLLVCRASSK